MALSKYKHVKKRAIKQFVNRHKKLKYLQHNCNDLVLNEDYFKIINIYGFGGIGKTSLLNKFLSQNEKSKEIDFIDFSLEVFKNDAIIDILIMLRKRIGKKCVLFDYALIKYWSKTKPSKFDDDFLTLIQDSKLLNILDITASAVGLNVAAIVKLINQQKEKIVSNLHKDFRIYISEIDSFSTSSLDQLYNRLPTYLGLDIERLVKFGKKKYCFLIDSFMQSNNCEIENDWLMELIGSTQVSLFIITSREKINWVDRNSEWSIFMDQILLEELSKNDSISFLNNHIDNTAQSLINTMIKSSQGIPIYLDLCVDVYVRKNKYDLKISESDFIFSSEQELVVNFFNHLSQNSQEILKILSVIGLFNNLIYSHLIKDLNLKCTLLDYEHLCSYTLLDYIHSESNLLKVHDVIGTNVIAILKPSYIECVLNSYFSYFSYKGLYDHNNGQLILILRNGFELIEKLNDSHVTVKQVESIIDIFLYLYDNGWWIEIRKCLKAIKLKNTTLICILMFSEGLYLRRTKNIKSGIIHLERIKPHSRKLGKHHYTFISELSYMYSLQGDYEKAYKSFKKLYDSFSDHDSLHERYYKKTITQYADILMLRGDFKKSMSILIEFNNDYTNDDVDLLESIRLLGHNYRFNFFLDQAQFNYDSAIARSINSISLKGKLLTNICETTCYFDPQKTLNIFDTAIELNKEIGSQIEIGKLYCAKGIAFVSMREFDLATNALQTALKIHRSVGYVSGELFVLIGYLFLSYAQTGKINNKIKSRIYLIVNKIKVYSYLLLPIFLLENDKINIDNCKKSYNWIDFEYTKDQYYDFLNNLVQLKK